MAILKGYLKNVGNNICVPDIADSIYTVSYSNVSAPVNNGNWCLYDRNSMFTGSDILVLNVYNTLPNVWNGYCIPYVYNNKWYVHCEQYDGTIPAVSGASFTVNYIKLK